MQSKFYWSTTGITGLPCHTAPSFKVARPGWPSPYLSGLRRGRELLRSADTPSVGVEVVISEVMTSLSVLGVSMAPTSDCTLSMDEVPVDSMDSAGSDSAGSDSVVINQRGGFSPQYFHNRLKCTTLGLDRGPS